MRPQVQQRCNGACLSAARSPPSPPAPGRRELSTSQPDRIRNVARDSLFSSIALVNKEFYIYKTYTNLDNICKVFLTIKKICFFFVYVQLNFDILKVPKNQIHILYTRLVSVLTNTRYLISINSPDK